jgi:cellulose synthase/poly-beta-1,6-N-acetylglucosamine synthase-like glycosyltransferase
MTWALLATIILLLLAAIYAGYPLALILLAGWRRDPVPAVPSPAAEPVQRATVLIAAYNEERSIAAKLASVLAAADAAADKAGIPVAVILGDDGSGDATAALAEALADPRITVIRCPRGGKAAVLNRIAPMAQGDILILTDADPLFLPDTIERIIRPFADPRVGAVAGHVAVRRAGSDPNRLAAFDDLYRRYESLLRRTESRLLGCSSADGGLFAIRRALFPMVPADVTDDFYISTAAVAAGQRIIYEPAARVIEDSIEGSRRNFHRRVRITVRGMTALWRRRRLMNPLVTGGYAIALIVHKLLRRLAPFLLLALWPAAGLAALTETGAAALFWALACGGLTLLLVAGLLGLLERVRWPRPVRMLHGIALHFAGQLIGVCQFAAGRRYSQWTPAK